jgi:hypothetical protein
MTNEDMLKILGEGMGEAARLLVAKVSEGSASAADIGQLRSMFKEAGGTLTLGFSPTPVGDTVLDSLKDIDPAMLN